MGGGRMGWRGACGVLALPWNTNGQKLQDFGGNSKGIWEGGVGCSKKGKGKVCDGSAKCQLSN